MNKHDATEIAYKNGYEQGVKDLAHRLKDIPRIMVYKWEIDQAVKELEEKK